MSRTFRVMIHTVASAAVNVNIDDEQLAKIADSFGTTVDALTVEDLVDEIESTYEAPTICVHCTGWSQPYSLTLGDVWDISYDKNGSIKDTIIEITDE